MKKTITALAVTALLATPIAAEATTYKGKTSSGHPVTMKIEGKRLKEIVGGVRMACLPIQGGGRSLAGSDVFGLKGTMGIKPFQTHSVMGKPAFHWREVTQKHDLWLKRRGNGYSGRLRMQYQFMISKFPIGTFSIYSCLGGATFKAKKTS